MDYKVVASRKGTLITNAKVVMFQKQVLLVQHSTALFEEQHKFCKKWIEERVCTQIFGFTAGLTLYQVIFFRQHQQRGYLGQCIEVKKCCECIGLLRKTLHISSAFNFSSFSNLHQKSIVLHFKCCSKNYTFRNFLNFDVWEPIAADELEYM